MKSPSVHPFLMIPGIPETAKKLLTRLLSEAALPVMSLGASVEAYRTVIHESGRRNPSTNVALGDAIADALSRFLGRVDERTPDEERRIVQAAVRYFVIEYDGYGHDLEHEDGLFGDARVVNAMLRWFGRDDLSVRLPPAAADRRPGLAMAS